MGSSRPKKSLIYEGIVGSLGIAVFAAVVLDPGSKPIPVSDLVFWLLAICAVAGELVPINLFLRTKEFSVTTSTCFGFAVLLGFGLPAALATLAVASVTATVAMEAGWLSPRVRRQSWTASAIGATFNVGQYSLALAAAGGLLAAVAGLPHTDAQFPFAPADLPLIMLAAVVLGVVNESLVAVTAILDHGLDATREYLQAWEFHLYYLGLLGLSPVLVVAVFFSPVLLLVLGLSAAVSFYSMRVAERNRHRAFHDPLTGLPNRLLFDDRVQSAITAAVRSGSPAAVMIFDLDGFKQVNDARGHRYGDQVLCEVAAEAQLRLRASDTLARLGGDEFGVLLPQVDGVEAAKGVAFALGRALMLNSDQAGGVPPIRASIGIACIPEHGHDVETLLERADLAMYQAKKSRGGVAIYDHSYTGAVSSAPSEAARPAAS